MSAYQSVPPLLLENHSDNTDMENKKAYVTAIRCGTNLMVAAGRELFTRPLTARNISGLGLLAAGSAMIMTWPLLLTSSTPDITPFDSQDLLQGLTASARDCITYAVLHEVIPSFVYRMLE